MDFQKAQARRKVLLELRIAIQAGIAQVCESHGHKVTYNEINSALADALKDMLHEENREENKEK